MQGPFVTTHQVPPFDKIATEHYQPSIADAVATAKNNIRRISDSEEKPTFENTIVALEHAEDDLTRVLEVFYPMLSALSTPEMMEVSDAVTPLLSEFSTSVILNEKLWVRVKAVHDSVESGEVVLSAIDRRLLDNTYRMFSRNGALLQGKQRERYAQLRLRASELGNLFRQNVLKGINAITIDLQRDEIAGLPEHIIAQARELAANNGKGDDVYAFTIHQPVYMAVMKYAARRDVRERFYRVYTGRNIDGEFSNINVVKETVALRAEYAELLGYRTYADYVLEETMAKTPGHVMDLLNKLSSAYRKEAESEIEALCEIAIANGVNGEIMPWDVSYLFNILRKQRYDYDEQRLRPYFELGNVTEGIFGLASRLYGIRFCENKELPVYHPDVKAYEVFDSDNSFLGVLYADFFTRDTKSPGAWMTEFKRQYISDDGVDSRPVISIVMNFSKPVKDDPTLLTPNEVRTFLHEFGHALHGLLSKVKYESMSGTEVYRDFVELPSQFNENFLHNREFLSTFAHHYKTGDSIPEEEIEKWFASIKFGAGYDCFRQLSFGLLDMAWHTMTTSQALNVGDVASFEYAAIAPVQLLPLIDKSLISPQFGHIFAGGYAAGYYSYKWSEVLDADAFDVFSKNGIYNPETAARFRHAILEKGGSEEPDKLYRDFKGDDPEIDALLRRDGIC